jgi:hypothetical protein
MTEIFINGKAIDLNDETIVLSFGVNDLFSIESTQGVFSNTFKIPATHNNNLAFGISNNILSTSTLPYESLPCEIYVNGLIAVAGLAQIQSASRFEYEILIVAGNGNWIDKLQNLNLQDFLFGCEFSHLWNEASVTGSRANIWSDVFIYANIDYGNLFFLAGSNVDWNELLPAVYCKYLLKQIFESIGYNIQSDWFDNNTTFETQVIPFSAKFRRSKNPALRNAGDWDSPLSSFYSPAVIVFNLVPPFIPPSWIRTDVRNLWMTNTISSSCYNMLDVPNQCLKVQDGVNITLEFDLRVIWSAGTSDIVFGMYAEHLDELGTLVQTPIFNATDIANNVPQFGQTIFNKTQTFTVGRGNMRFRFFGFSQAFGNALQVPDFEVKVVGYELLSDENFLNIDINNNWLELAGTLPDMAVTDFILTLANQYGLIFQESANTNTIQIFQFTDIINNLTNPKDWSNKLDLSSEPVITFEVDRYAKKNWFQYAPDTVDEYLTRQPLLGRASLDINQSNLPAEQVLFESVFSASVRLLSYSGTIELFYIPVYEGSGTNDVNARIAYVVQDTSALLTIQPSAFFTNPQPNVYFKDLEFGQLLPKYYPLYSQILNNMKSVKCLMKLNSVDVNTINFKEPIWIDFFGAYFYLNLIDQFNLTTQDSTPVELILLRN